MKNRIKVSVAFTDDKKGMPLRKHEVCDLVAFVCHGEKSLHGSYAVIFIGSEGIRDLNARFLKHDYPTDVLSFPLHEYGETLEGEIYVCTETAEIQAHEYRVSFKEELMRLLVHGVLHLIGYDDAELEDRKRMIAKGEHYLRQFQKRTTE